MPPQWWFSSRSPGFHELDEVTDKKYKHFFEYLFMQSGLFMLKLRTSVWSGCDYKSSFDLCARAQRRAAPVAVDKPRPQEQYFQESPSSEMSRDSWENWTPGERMSRSGGSWDAIHRQSSAVGVLWWRPRDSCFPTWSTTGVTRGAVREARSCVCPVSRATVLHLRLPTDQRCSTAPWATGKYPPLHR